MTRLTADYTVDANDRDHNKTYRITEMSAAQGEAWASRALLALAKGGMLPGNLDGAGMAGIAQQGPQALRGLEWDILAPMMDEMMECVRFKTSSGIIRDLAEGDIEEITTRFNLRVAIWNLHTGFLRAVKTPE